MSRLKQHFYGHRSINISADSTRSAAELTCFPPYGCSDSRGLETREPWAGVLLLASPLLRYWRQINQKQKWKHTTPDLQSHHLETGVIMKLTFREMLRILSSLIHSPIMLLSRLGSGHPAIIKIETTLISWNLYSDRRKWVSIVNTMLTRGHC